MRMNSLEQKVPDTLLEIFTNQPLSSVRPSAGCAWVTMPDRRTKKTGALRWAGDPAWRWLAALNEVVIRRFPGGSHGAGFNLMSEALNPGNANANRPAFDSRLWGAGGLRSRTSSLRDAQNGRLPNRDQHGPAFVVFTLSTVTLQ